MWSRNPSSSHLGLNHQWHGWLFSSPPAVSQQLWLACHKALKLWCAPLLAKAVWIGEGIKMIKFQWMQQLIYHQGASSGDIYNDVYYLYKLYIYREYISICVCVCVSLSLSLHCHLAEISSQAKAEQVSIAQSDTGTIPQLEWAVTSK